MMQPGRRCVGLTACLLLCTPIVGATPQAAQSQATPPAASAEAQNEPQAQAPASVKDILQGTDESDTLTGGDADNWLFGKKGDDFLRGDKGRDAIDGSDGDDTLDGGDGDDVIDGGAGGDTIRGGGGNDIADGGDDDDLLDGGPDNDDLDGGDGDDLLRGAAGDDVLAGGDGNDSLNGGAGADRLSGNDGEDVLDGGADDDDLSGGDGNDLLVGGAGNDRLDAGIGNDVVRGGPGDDSLLGSGGADVLDGEPGHDVLIGADGQDLLNGGPGDDWLLGSLGADAVNGGEGNDVLLLRAGDVPAGESESVDGDDGSDLLILNGLVAPAGLAPAGLDDPLTGGTYRLRSIERIEYTHLFPHVDRGGTDESSLLLVNPSDTAAEGRIVVSGEDGALVPVAAGGDDPRNDVPFTIPPLGSLGLDRLLSGDAQGSVQVFSTVSIAGVTSAVLPGAGAIAGLAEAPLVDNAMVPVFEDRASGASTGITVLNGAVRSVIKLTLHAEAGPERDNGSTEIALPPYGRRTGYVRDFFPLLGDFRGTLTVEGGIDRPQDGGPLAVTVIQRIGDRVAGTYPAVPAGPMPASAPLVFTGLPDGAGMASSITLVNPSRFDRARGTIVFFDESGAPRVVGVNGLPAGANIPYDLAPFGSTTVTLPPDGPARRGAARVEMAEGVVGGIVRVSSPAPGATLHAGPSPVVSTFIAPVRRGTGLTTLTVSGTSVTANLDLTLRDAQGEAVTGGRTTLSVPANGQVTRTLEALFPAATAVAAWGTLTATGDAPVGVRVTADDGSLGRVSLMPIVPLR